MTDASSGGEKQGWFGRLRQGLSRSSTKLSEGITGIFTKRKLDQATLDELEELLIQADLGAGTAAKLVGAFGKTRFGQEIAPEEVKSALAGEIAKILEPVAQPLTPTEKPSVVLVVGVNGSGKTTTIGKLAQLYREDGKKVMLAAGDTFRAAAVEQLQIWGERVGAPVIAKGAGADPAGLAYEALEGARAEGIDILLIDTAGRLHTKSNLMEELRKVIRVLRKLDASAPHHCLLVLDATTGQNALAQVETFKQMVDVTGLIVTKLDGTAKGGVLVAIADKFKLPVHAIGIGEKAGDLRPFSAEAFARGLMGLG
jgi:fused signal recognition particle receptor